MTRGQKRLRATLSLLGTIIGAGVFGMPAMIGAWGVPLATLGFAVVTAIVLAVHLYLTEAVLAYKPDARLAGFARHWIGPAGGVFTGAVQTLGALGTNLAYIILGGEFLMILGNAAGISWPIIAWQALFWLAGVMVVMMGLDRLAKIEAFLTWGLVGVMVLLIGVFTSQMDWMVAFEPAGTFTFEPYGIFLFALLGYGVVPEMERLTSGNAQDMRKSVIRGTLVAAGLTYAFGVAGWLASGGTLGRGAADIVALLPPGLRMVVPLFGFLAIATSYITSAYDVGSMFRLDFRMTPWLAWAASLSVPFLLLLLGPRDFLSVIGFVGALFSAAICIVIALIGRAALRKTVNAQFGNALWWWQEAIPVAVIAALLLAGFLWYSV